MPPHTYLWKMLLSTGLWEEATETPRPSDFELATFSLRLWPPPPVVTLIVVMAGAPVFAAALSPMAIAALL